LRAQTGAILLAGGRKLWASSWHFAGLPRLEWVIGDFDVLHICGPGYRIPTRRPSVATIHDIGLITHPHFFSPQYCWLFRGHMQDLLRRKAHIIAVSRYTADEFRRAFGGELCIDVVHEGVADVFLQPPEPALIDQVRARIGAPFFLTAGSFNPRKNLLRVCRAFAGIADRVPHSLVLVGARGWDDDEVWAELDSPALRGRVHTLGFVGDRELCALYASADALVFASLFEGFGLPAVEAMGAGCPVIAADRTSLPEVVGDAGVLVDPLDTTAISEAMRRLATEPALRSELSARGRERARQYSWAHARAATCAVYRELARSA
jgi:glycosyltransferase involved in cell wall biosynthesis